MNKKTIAICSSATMLVIATPAFAQSSVTLYGLLDTAIRYQTNAAAGGKDKVSMDVGPETHSRWGLRGSEDLGGGLSAIFRLENGFEINTGALHSKNTLFSRQAFVGLSDERWGSLTFGNQYAPAYDTLGDIFDPIEVGDYWQDSWMYNGIGNYLTVNNSVKYKGSFDGLSVDAIYGFGNNAGSVGLGSTYGVELTYAFGPAQINAGFQQTDVEAALTKEGAKENFLHVSGAYQITPKVRLLAGWLRNQDRTGLTDAAMGQSDSPATALFITKDRVSPNRIDDTFYVGANWQATDPLLFTFAYYYGMTRNAALLDGSLGTGVNYSATILAEYSLSKHTEIYGTVDFSRGNGAFAADYAADSSGTKIGRTNNVGVALGIRQLF